MLTLRIINLNRVRPLFWECLVERCYSIIKCCCRVYEFSTKLWSFCNSINSLHSYSAIVTWQIGELKISVCRSDNWLSITCGYQRIWLIGRVLTWLNKFERVSRKRVNCRKVSSVCVLFPSKTIGSFVYSSISQHRSSIPRMTYSMSYRNSNSITGIPVGLFRLDAFSERSPIY